MGAKLPVLAFDADIAMALGVKDSAQDVVDRLGIAYEIPVTMHLYGHVWFWLPVIPEGLELPGCCELHSLDPDEYVGWGISAETVDYLRRVHRGIDLGAMAGPDLFWKKVELDTDRLAHFD